MSQRRIVITGSIPPIVGEILGRFGQILVAPQSDEESLLALMPNTIGLLARGTAPISARLINSAKDLQVIGRSGVGFDNVDVAAATARRIPVVYTPGVGAVAVAEGTMAVILALAKRLIELDRKTRDGEWSARDNTAILDLRGATLGVVGLGRIGREVARLALAFEMRVLAYDPHISPETAEKAGVSLEPLDSLLAASDFISLHAPLNESTRGMFDRRCLSGIKPGAVLVNLARGGLFDSLDTVFEALASGQISAVGLDVYPVEPPDISHPIFSHPRTLCTPHAVSLTVGAAHSIFTGVSRDMAAVLEGRIPENVVNPEVYHQLPEAPKL
jgi:D-3-phosphoglycerate dehydrogenase